MLSSLSPRRRWSDGRRAATQLAERQSAVVRRDPVVAQDGEAAPAGRAGRPRRAACWRTPRRSGRPCPARSAPAARAATGRRQRGHRAVEARRDQRRRRRPRARRRRRRRARAPDRPRSPAASRREGVRAGPRSSPRGPAPSSSMAACASYPARWHTPASEETASNSRPMLDVGTQFESALQLPSAGALVRPGRPRTGGRSSVPVDAGRAQMGQRHAVRAAHGGVAAGQRDVREVRRRVSRRSRRAGTRRPTRRRRRRSRCRRRRRRSPARRRAVLGHRGGDVRVMVLDAYDAAGRPRSARPTRRSGSPGAGRRPGARAARR